MLNKIDVFVNFFKAALDLALYKKQRDALLYNLDILGNKKYKSICKAFRFYQSKRMSDLINKSVIKRSEKLERYLDNSVSLSSSEHWEKCINHSGPVLFITPHYGPFAIGCLKAIRDFSGKKQVNAFYDSPDKNKSTSPYQEILSSLGYNFNPIFNNRKGLMHALKSLKKNQALTIMPDVYEVNSQTIYVPFCSHLTCAMSGPAFFALKSSALIVHAYVKNTWSGKVVIQLDEPYTMATSEDPERDVFVQTCRTFQSLERQLKESAEHWMYLPNLKSRLNLKLEGNEADIKPIIKSLTKSLNIIEGKIF